MMIVIVSIFVGRRFGVIFFLFGTHILNASPKFLLCFFGRPTVGPDTDLQGVEKL